jgi:hypothetical protein
MPGQKSMRLAKKGSDPSFPDAGFRRFSPAMPLATASLCGDMDNGTLKGSPGPF